MILVNVRTIGRDSTFFEEPNYNFVPERYIGNIDVAGTDFALISSGAGRRISPNQFSSWIRLEITHTIQIDDFNLLSWSHYKNQCVIHTTKNM